MVFIKILFSAINAKYIHSSLALRYLYSYNIKYKEHIQIKEFTINNSNEFILSEIFKIRPDIIGFSCYIWNIEIIKNIVSDIKKILPNTKILLGGPEVSYTKEEHLKNEYIDFIVFGEGEETTKEFIEHFLFKNKDFKDIKGLAYKQGENIIINEKRENISLDKIGFPYKHNFLNLENKIIYYESSRGCPFRCQYCLSSSEKLRFLSIDRVKEDLKFFLDKKVKQVKFVDRTFNCNKNHALEVWDYLINNNNFITNFHFEISANMLDEDMFILLKKAPRNLFQFEIGIQSTNKNTLSIIERNMNLEDTLEKIKILNENKNIHKHLDLIVGLPKESFNSFKNSFNMVYNLNSDNLQLGFLKLLKGSLLRQNAYKYNIVYRDKAPYEVLYTKDISYEEILHLKGVEQMLSIFYNSNKVVYTLKFVLKYFKTPFELYSKLFNYYKSNFNEEISHNKITLYTIFRDFLHEEVQDIDKNLLDNFLKLDIYKNENIKNLPNWLVKTNYNEIKEKIYKFYTDDENKKIYFNQLEGYTIKQLIRMCHIEIFDYDIISFVKGEKIFIEKTENFALFTYYNKDLDINFFNINL